MVFLPLETVRLTDTWRIAPAYPHEISGGIVLLSPRARPVPIPPLRQLLESGGFLQSPVSFVPPLQGRRFLGYSVTANPEPEGLRLCLRLMKEVVMQITVIVIVVLYMLTMLGIGYYASRRIRSTTDFMVAGRRMGPVLMAGTLAATEIGGGSSLGVVEKASNLGNAQWGLSAAWYVLTMGIAFVILTFLAPKIRSTEVKTVPEYFRRKYGPVAGVFTSITMFLPLIGLTAGQFMASATILSVMLGIGWKVSLITVAVVVTAYAVMGGMWSVAITDFVQVGLIVTGMAIAIPFAVQFSGGWDQVVAHVPPETFDLIKGIGGPKAIIALVIMYVATFTVGQEAVSRYYSARDGKAARQGSVLAALVNGI